jgi:hypothetical protein
MEPLTSIKRTGLTGTFLNSVFHLDNQLGNSYQTTVNIEEVFLSCNNARIRKTKSLLKDSGLWPDHLVYE